MALRFPDRPATSVQELQRDVSELVPQLERRILRDVSIGTSSTPVAHGLRAVPRGRVIVYQSADARVWDAARADTQTLYLQASAAVTVDIEVIA